jgi:hypothetical protein
LVLLKRQRVVALVQMYDLVGASYSRAKTALQLPLEAKLLAAQLQAVARSKKYLGLNQQLLLPQELDLRLVFVEQEAVIRSPPEVVLQVVALK